MKPLLTIIIFFSFSYSKTPSKKEVLLSIAQKYLPDNVVVLKKYDEATVNFLARGDSLEEYICDFSTVIHEGFHKFEDGINFYDDTLRHYRLDDSTTIAIRKFKSFPSRKLNDFVPTAIQKEIFRYSTYINSADSNDDTQQNGFLGLLEEYAAYYQSLKAYTSTYYFLKDTFGWTKPQVWINYLNNGSEIYAINEFKLFFSWYLQYSKSKSPDIYKKIVSDSNIKRLYTKIDFNSKQLINTFLVNRDNIIANIKSRTEYQGGIIKLVGTEVGYNIDEHVKTLRKTEVLLKESNQKILKQLKEVIITQND